MFDIYFNKTSFQLGLKKNGADFFSSKGIIITGENADGKTEYINNQKDKLENDCKLIRINSKKIDKFDLENNINSHYSALIESHGLQSEVVGLYDFIEKNEKILLNLIENEVLNKKISFINGFADFHYADGKEIKSQGELNLIKLFVIVTYYAEREFVKIFFIDEPNTNLDDKHSAELVNNIITTVYQYFDKKILVVATTNNENILEELEGFLIFNVKTKEICYSSDLIGNREALKRITSSISSQPKLLSENRRLLSDALLNKRGFYMSNKEYVVFTDLKISNGRYRALKYINLSPIEKVLFDKLFSISVPTFNKNFSIFDDYAEEV